MHILIFIKTLTFLLALQLLYIPQDVSNMQVKLCPIPSHFVSLGKILLFIMLNTMIHHVISNTSEYCCSQNIPLFSMTFHQMKILNYSGI